LCPITVKLYGFYKPDIDKSVFKIKNYNLGLMSSEAKKLHLPIIIEMDEDGYYIASCPQFKGCHSCGETADEALENIREVALMCLEETDAGRIGSLGRFE